MLRSLDDIPDQFRGCAVTIGNFDGVHHGHAKIIERVRQLAETVNGKLVVFTFEPHPAIVLRPDLAPAPLTWLERKADLLAGLGVDAVVAYPTDRALLKLTPEQFFQSIVVDKLAAKAIVEGPNFCFGRDRQGDVALLRKLCSQQEIQFDVVEPITAGDDTLVSSSRIREAIARGEIDHANEMLTQPYRIRGIVARGAGRGSTIGFPTANIDDADTLLPADGVYAGRVQLDGAEFAAAINVGAAPTFGDDKKRVEVHIICFDRGLYGQMLEVDFLRRLRTIQSFDCMEELVAQLRVDIGDAKEAYRQDR
ncbi:MAG: bifunctional riboflavin kinase/FAD synthetase [Planctomycetales bacterium]|nr:bifunctional riboflavin kinase/FAD synthetase [Planctomycetales bacterium]